jgi:hypothetical protein
MSTSVIEGMRTFPKFNPLALQLKIAISVGSCLAPAFPAGTRLAFDPDVPWEKDDVVLLEAIGAQASDRLTSKTTVKQICKAPDGQWLLLCKQPAIRFNAGKCHIVGPLVACWPGLADEISSRLVDEEGDRYTALALNRLQAAGATTRYADLRQYGLPLSQTHFEETAHV